MMAGSGFAPHKCLLESHYIVIASIRCGRVAEESIVYILCILYGATVASQNQFSFKILWKRNTMAQITVGPGGKLAATRIVARFCFIFIY